MVSFACHGDGGKREAITSKIVQVSTVSGCQFKTRFGTGEATDDTSSGTRIVFFLMSKSCSDVGCILQQLCIPLTDSPTDIVAPFHCLFLDAIDTISH